MPASALSGARTLLSRALDASGGALLVALSGGKDSLTTLALAHEAASERGGRVECFFMYLVPGLRCVEATIDAMAVRYRVRVHRFPHWDTSRMLRHAVLMPHRPGLARVPALHLVDVENAARRASGIEWIACGYRSDDSLRRRLKWDACYGFDEKARVVAPLWNWRTSDVVSFNRRLGLHACPSFGKKAPTSGVTLEPDVLADLRERWPDDYAKILRVFPFAGAQLRRPERQPPSGVPHPEDAEGETSGGIL